MKILLISQIKGVIRYMDSIQENRGDVHIISIKTDIIADNVSELKKILGDMVSTSRFNVVLDMSAVNYIDSSGLAAIILKLKEFRKNKGDLRIAAVNDSVKTIFDVTFLTSLFKIYPNVDEACKDFN